MADEPEVTIGTTVYNANGDPLGQVRGFEKEAFVVSTAEGIAAFSVEHERAGHEFGEAELMWRCSDCGAVGDIEALPDECPDCGAPREHIYYWTED